MRRETKFSVPFRELKPGSADRVETSEKKYQKLKDTMNEQHQIGNNRLCCSWDIVKDYRRVGDLPGRSPHVKVRRMLDHTGSGSQQSRRALTQRNGTKLFLNIGCLPQKFSTR